eukprot:6207264-Pleurochrysis_carterae.AAC.1
MASCLADASQKSETSKSKAILSAKSARRRGTSADAANKTSGRAGPSPPHGASRHRPRRQQCPRPRKHHERHGRNAGKKIVCRRNECARETCSAGMRTRARVEHACERGASAQAFISVQDRPAQAWACAAWGYACTHSVTFKRPAHT